jgi:hypothetical protein
MNPELSLVKLRIKPPYDGPLQPLEARRFLLETHEKCPEFNPAFVLHALGGLSGPEVFRIQWKDLNEYVLSLEEEGRSVHLDSNAAQWLDLYRPADGAGLISSVDEHSWETYLDRFFQGKYQPRELVGAHCLYAETHRKGAAGDPGPETTCLVRDAEIFASLSPGLVLSPSFEELVQEINRILRVKSG